MTYNRKNYPLHELIDDAYEAVHSLHTRNVISTEYPSGFTALGMTTGEIEPGELIVIASRPSMGKSILAMNIAQFLGANKIPKKVASAIFSLDIPKEQLVMRMLSATACISFRRMKTGHLEDSDMLKLNGAKESLRQSEIYIDDTPGIGLIELITKVRRLKTDNDV